MKFDLVMVDRFPKPVTAGKLFWSREFEMCAHLCACGCGDVIKLPVDAANYRVFETSKGVTLRPSVGNWGVCDAHYLITDGKVAWAGKWSPDQIKRGRDHEDARRESYYAVKRSRLAKLIDWLRRLLR
jgi:hypothetical protein